jgi:hypothetical protein
MGHPNFVFSAELLGSGHPARRRNQGRDASTANERHVPWPSFFAQHDRPHLPFLHYLPYLSFTLLFRFLQQRFFVRYVMLSAATMSAKRSSWRSRSIPTPTHLYPSLLIFCSAHDARHGAPGRCYNQKSLLDVGAGLEVEPEPVAPAARFMRGSTRLRPAFFAM